jgi:hypothetical protein
MRIHWPVPFPALKYELLLLIVSIIWVAASTALATVFDLKSSSRAKGGE